MNNFLYIFLEDKFLNSQHGFIPSKGTLTAWREVLSLDDHKYIFEFDLRKYFDNVNCIKIAHYLKDQGVPLKFVGWLAAIHISSPIINSQELKDKGIAQTDNEIYEGKTKFSFYNRNSIPSEKKPWSIGVPQGSNTGPLLALIPLIDFLSQKSSISYADDGLFYSNKPFEILDRPEWGIYLHKDKSGWVKWDGNWLKPLKFLGLTWNGKSLRASTRKGSTLLADTKRSALSIISNEKLKSVKGVYSLTWETIFKAQFGGTIISKLYNGTWDLSDVLRHVNFHVSEKSALYGQRNVNFFNASSYASYTLIRILSNEEKTKFNRPKWPEKYESHRS